MGILEALDLNSKRMLEPSQIYDQKHIADVCVVTFSIHVKEHVLENYACETVASVRFANGEIPIYFLKNENVLFYLSPIGAAISGAALEEVHCVTGANHFIFFGSCGLLDETYKNQIIIPSSAYREEGFSYHYEKPSDYIEIKNHAYLKKVLDANNVENVTGKVWTTDAIFMETIDKVNKRREEGCLCVDMESSGLQALANYLDINFYIFFFTGDILKDVWDQADIGNQKEKVKQLDCFKIALCIAQEILKK